ncbi:hypothetical protein WA1_36375 [Scytonema hofmannii PCC 7110]|uniref:Uncharacterized protein n=1 Tax=Scytonema hofmannii PCC 7110 TaxID=128403 RepID=A0A139X1V0_9CYAN|nr:hypothetical protein [Scytonema hofmannii]KYC38654.1 hypothetical protein WA1_36375 [Scytonema hofmannii PCC 7110]
MKLIVLKLSCVLAMADFGKSFVSLLHTSPIYDSSLVMAAEKTQQSQSVQITQVTLLAREEKTPPVGHPPTLNRDIGFASVFLRLENLQEANSQITIQNIKIVNVSHGRSQNFSYSPQKITLRPLENSEQAFHLKNKTGYVGTGKVKAVVTYQIGERVNAMTSAPVEVERR